MSKRQNFSVNTRKIFKKTNSENYTEFNDLLPNLPTKNYDQQISPQPPTPAAHAQQCRVNVRADSINNSEERCATKRSEILVIATSTF